MSKCSCPKYHVSANLNNGIAYIAKDGKGKVPIASILDLFAEYLERKYIKDEDSPEMPNAPRRSSPSSSRCESALHAERELLQCTPR